MSPLVKTSIRVVACLAVCAFQLPALPQTGSSTSGSGSQVIPRLIKYADTIRDANRTPRSGTVGMIFAIYPEREGGAPLWQEAQNVNLEADGRYAVLLGSESPEGLPPTLFSSGEPRWLGVQVQLPGENEQPRVLLVSVPYAMKAADAETLGGRPASEYVLRQQITNWNGTLSAGLNAPPSSSTAAVTSQITNPGTANFLAKYLNNVDLGMSAIFESAGNVGVGTSIPSAPLHVVRDASMLSDNGAAAIFSAASDPNQRLMFGYDRNANVGYIQSTHTGVNVRPLVLNPVGGSVGLGISAPVAIMHVAQDSSATSDLSAGLIVGHRGTPGKRMMFGFDAGIDAAYVQSTHAGVNVKPFLLNPSGGNVGIGTTTPLDPLHIAGVVRTTGGVRFSDGTLQTTSSALAPGSGLQNTGGALSLKRTCTGGELLKWNQNAASWDCAQDMGNGGSISEGAGIILTPNPISGSGSIAADFLPPGGENGISNSVARSDHGHDASYLRRTGGILTGNLLGTSATFQAAPSAGVTPAVMGSVASTSTNASGVRGEATASSGSTIGVLGSSASSTNDAKGVAGSATAMSGVTIGVQGQSFSSSGKGVEGLASSATGPTIGVRGYVQSNDTSASAGVFNTEFSGPRILSGVRGGGPGGVLTEVFRVDSTGDVKASAYFDLANPSRRVSLRTDCQNGQVLLFDTTVTPNEWKCATAPGGVSSVNASAQPGLTVSPSTGPVTVNLNFTGPGGDNGTGSNVARGDHVHDSRYYSTSAADAAFVNISGDTMSGRLVVNFSAAGTSALEGNDTSSQGGKGITGTSSNGTGVEGTTSGPTGSTGVAGRSTNGFGVFGQTSGSTTSQAGVKGEAFQGTARGVLGRSLSTAGAGVVGETTGSDAAAVIGDSSYTGTTGLGPVGVKGVTRSPIGVGIQGENVTTSTSGGTAIGVFGSSQNGITTIGVKGLAQGGSGGTLPIGSNARIGVLGDAGSFGVIGLSGTSGIGVYAKNQSNGFPAIQADNANGSGHLIEGWSQGALKFRSTATGDVGIRGCLFDLDNNQAISGTCFSDRRLKKNIATLAPTLRKLSQITPVTFDWAGASLSNDRNYGVVADEIAGVMPEIVSRQENGFLAVRYEVLPILLLQAIKELSAENEQLKAHLQEKEIEIEQRLRKLEKRHVRR